MIEIRWFTTNRIHPILLNVAEVVRVLQYRRWIHTPYIETPDHWSEWQDVPEVSDETRP